MKCKSCGSEILDNSQYCISCGSKQEIVSNSITHSFQGKVKERGIQYIFVTSLVLMILLGIRSLSALSSINSYIELAEDAKLGLFSNDTSSINAFLGSAVFSFIMTFLSFISILFLFIFSCIVKNQNREIEKRKSLAKIIFILSLISLCSVSLYFISECILYISFLKVSETVVIENLDSIKSQMSTSLVTVLAMSGLLIAGLIKSLTFLRVINSKH